MIIIHQGGFDTFHIAKQILIFIDGNSHARFAIMDNGVGRDWHHIGADGVWGAVGGGLAGSLVRLVHYKVSYHFSKCLPIKGGGFQLPIIDGWGYLPKKALVFTPINPP